MIQLNKIPGWISIGKGTSHHPLICYERGRFVVIYSYLEEKWALYEDGLLKSYWPSAREAASNAY